MQDVLTHFRAIWSEFKRLTRDTEGVTAMEYGLIAATTCLAIVSTVQSLSQPIGNAFQAMLNSLNLACPSC